MTSFSQPTGALTAVQKLGLLVGLAAFTALLIIPVPSLPDDARRMLAIFVLAISLWITEAIPLFATATLIILLEVLLISSSALVPVSDQAPSSADLFATMADPVIILFLGGFLIADGAAKFGLDRNIAAVLIKPFSSSARSLLLGMMLITALLSLFMSNTATTAAMFAVVLPLVAVMPTPRARAALALAIPLAANIGGMGTPVSTPPNAIAVGVLAAKGVAVTFVEWMMLAMPFVVVLLFLAWFVLSRMVPKGARVELQLTSHFDTSRNARIFYAVAALTIVLWMTEPLHSMSSSTVGFIPVVVLLATRVMSGDDIRALDWPVLWLVAGGIALGEGITATELDSWLLGSLEWDTMGRTGVLVVLVCVALALSNVMSNSATANLLIPPVVGFANVLGLDMVVIAVILALATSLGISMPISTPPNAIAYSTGFVPLKAMAIVGLIVGVAGASLLAFVMPLLWQTMGFGT